MSSGTLLRIVTAAALIPAVVAIIWWGSTGLVAALAGLVAILAVLEFFALGEHMGFHAYRTWTCVAALAIFAEQWSAARADSLRSLADWIQIGREPRVTLDLVLVAFVLGMAAIALATRRALAEVLPAVSLSAGALIFIVVPFSAVVRLDGPANIGRQLLLFTLVVVWVGDTAAYFVGRAVGRTKMAPQLSPGKTWEGAAANVIGSLAVGVIFSRWMQIDPLHMVAMGGLASVAGQAGDLLESAYKRSAGVKDSGTILPGHGGVLDRIDALILAAPAVWYYFEWVIMRRF